MGFSGGGSNILLPHTHDGTVSQDGGPLNFNNITQSQSAAGEVFFSDGVHLQQLAYPAVPAGETLTAAAASVAPSWQAASGAVYQLLGTTELAAPAAEISLTWPSVSFADVASVEIYFSCHSSGGANGIQFQFNGISGATDYAFDEFMVSGGAITATNEAGAARIWTLGASDTFVGHISISSLDPSTTAATHNYLTYAGNVRQIGAKNWVQFGGHINNQSVTTSDAVRIYPPAGNLATGAVIQAFVINRT